MPELSSSYNSLSFWNKLKLLEFFFFVTELERKLSSKFNEKKYHGGSEESGTVEEEEGESESNMVPKPYDDLLIEPAGDYDIIYADYNTTLVSSF